jgi:hypothetical protein
MLFPSRRPSFAVTTSLQPTLSSTTSVTVLRQYIQHLEIQPAKTSATVAIIEGNDTTFATTSTSAGMPTTLVQLLTENEIMRIEMLYQSYTLKFGYAVGDSEILTDCSFVEQTLGVMGGGGSDNTNSSSPRLEEDDKYYENETSYSPTYATMTTRGTRRRGETIEELSNDESLQQQHQYQQRQQRRGLQQQSTTTLTPPTRQPSKSMIGRPVVTIRFNMMYTTTKNSNKYNITHYPILFKRYVSTNLTQVTIDMNNLDLHTIVNVMDIKLLNSEEEASTSIPNTVSSNNYPSFMPSSITTTSSSPLPPSSKIFNKSFIIGGIIGTGLAIVIAIVTIIYVKGWRQRITIQREVNNQDNSKKRRHKQHLQQQQQEEQEAANVELTNTNITSHIDPCMDEAIAGGDGNESLLSIQQSIPPQHLMAENLQQSSSVHCPSVHCPPMINTTFSTTSIPFGVVDDDLSSARTTINVNDSSTNDQFYANNLVTIPFRDDEDCDTAILPIQLQRLTTVDSVPLHHSDDDDDDDDNDDDDDVTLSSTAAGGESEMTMDRNNASDNGHLPPFSSQHMLINDASFRSAASSSNDDSDDNDNDEKYYYNNKIQPDMLELDGSTDEFDNYKNQDLEILRTAIEQSVNNVDMLLSLAITYAYTTSIPISTCLGWFGGEEHHSRIEASCLCDTYDWLKTNELSTMDSV